MVLDKKYQKKDWSRRPLSEEMLAYAARDVLYLIPLWKILTQRLKAKNRMAWVAEECRNISIARPVPETVRPLFLKVKGSGRLNRRSLAVLESLLEMRLEIARKKDLPPFKVISPGALIRLAEEKPAYFKALKRSGILSEKQLAMYAEAVCSAVQKALDMTNDNLPVYPREKRTPMSREVCLRVNALKQWRETAAQQIGIDSGFILPNALAIGIARQNPQTVGQLDEICEMKDWQKKTFGGEIIEVLNGVF